jgi:lipid-binding SYLF domain-containing protein
MNIFKTAVAALAALVIGLSCSPAGADDGSKTLGKSVAAFKEITAVKNGVPPALFQDIQAVAIFPKLSKNDFIVSGRAGSGVIMLRGSDGKWSNPVFIKLNGGTLGWQIVGGPMDIMLVFKTRPAPEELMNGRLSLLGKSTPIIGPLGKNLKGATPAQLNADITTYVMTRDIFKEVTLASATLRLEPAVNDAYYGAKQVPAADIVSGKLGKESPEAGALQKLLTGFAARK